MTQLRMRNPLRASRCELSRWCACCCVAFDFVFKLNLNLAYHYPRMTAYNASTLNTLPRTSRKHCESAMHRFYGGGEVVRVFANIAYGERSRCSIGFSASIAYGDASRCST